MNPDRPNRAPELKRALTNVRRVCDALGLTVRKPWVPQAAGLICLCPWHTENTPSCSVQLRNGVMLAKCHGCGAGGDVLSLIAAARGLSMRTDFRSVLVEAARLAGRHDLVDELEGRAVTDAAPSLALPAPSAPEAPEAARAYPEDAERFWGILEPLTAVGACADYLRGRGIDPELVEAADVARAIPDTGALPAWARYRGRSWRETGHRIVVAMFDAGGALRSVRGWRVTDGDSPKRLPPGGRKASELVMADAWALAWLRGHRQPERIVIAEGEPDFAVWTTRVNDPHTAVIGIVSGSWHRALSERVPVGCRVDVRTDHDDAGERYYEEIAAGLKRRTPAVFRSVEAA